MSRIKNLYTYLVTNRLAELDGWYQEYTSFTGDVEKVRNALKNGGGVTDPATYQQTSFAGEDDPWGAFAYRLIYQMKNGIASRGQSIMNKDHFPKFIADPDFVKALEELIKNPVRATFDAFGVAWETVRASLGARRNPLLVRRVLAACTPTVTSTVNDGDFGQVLWWLVSEGILPTPSDPLADWYDLNVDLMNFLGEEFRSALLSGETSPQLLSIFVWNLFENITNPFSLKRQIIRYGAPGTGKTHTAKRDAQLMFDIWREQFAGEIGVSIETNRKVVQFHPSYGYEDFIEGLRPVLDNDRKAQLVLQNGTFKHFCICAAVWEKDIYEIRKGGAKLPAKWEDIKISDLKPHADRLTGERWSFILSHPRDEKRVADAVPPFFFIIDEINRAELSRVLGELMLCLEYRGVESAISTQYAALNDERNGMINMGAEYKFFVPHNIFVIGTMNTIDRSVESFDLALRRRFRWERIDPDITLLRYHLQQRDSEPGNAGYQWAGLADRLESLNEMIRGNDLLGEDYQIGHAYCMNLRYPSRMTCAELREKLWWDSIRPLIEEYLRGSGKTEQLMP